MKYTFETTEVQGKYGHHFPLLTANEYPYIRCQVVPTPPEQRDEILAALEQRREYIVHSKGRTDFCVIQAGGTKDGIKLDINQLNHKEVDRAICACVQAAADFWAERTSKPQ